MLKKSKKLNQDKGFTIIEVLIVLAIAALIILVVLLAVPALQRSQRNTARKTDAGRVSAAVVDFTANNQGALPTTAAHCTALLNSLPAGGLAVYINLTCAAIAATGPAAPAANTFYIATNAGIYTAGTAVSNTMVLAEQAQCNGSNVTQAGTARQTALLYTVEAGSGWNWACVNPQ